MAIFWEINKKITVLPYATFGLQNFVNSVCIQVRGGC